MLQQTRHELQLNAWRELVAFALCLLHHQPPELAPSDLQASGPRLPLRLQLMCCHLCELEGSSWNRTAAANSRGTGAADSQSESMKTQSSGALDAPACSGTHSTSQWFRKLAFSSSTHTASLAGKLTRQEIAANTARGIIPMQRSFVRSQGACECAPPHRQTVEIHSGFAICSIERPYRIRRTTRSLN